MDNTTITTGEVRLSYVHLVTPYTSDPKNPEKYSTTVLVPKTDTATKAAIDMAIASAKEKGSKKWGGVIPPVIAICIHDGDGARPSDGMPFGDECKGHWVFTASASKEYKPRVVNEALQDVLDAREIYSGMYGKVNVSFFAYNSNGKKGIGCALNCVMKTRDGESLSNHVTVEDAFGKPGTGAGAPATGISAPAINPFTGQPYAPGAAY